MSAPVTTLNEAPAEPELKDLLDLLKKDIFLSLNSMHVGTIRKFDAEKQTCQVSINYLRTYFQKDSAGLYSPVTKEYPLLTDVPVIVLGGGKTALTFPIAVGDECLLFFNDRSIDGWFSGSSDSPVPGNRLHSMSDGFALVGVRSLANVLTGYDTARAVFRHGDNVRIAAGLDHVQVEFGPAAGPFTSIRLDDAVGITIKADAAKKISLKNDSQNQFTLLNNLITEIKNLNTQVSNLATACAAITVSGVTSGPAVSGPPANAAAISAVATNIATITTNMSTIATNLGSLMQ